ncbi:hypothetical protein [Variovorax paradoxus]|uniref:hypothetical protein n=1 Tax=Variovorax paradoxus TaxID=34073 RepID=UPI0027D7919D|nr:hypothetical protein [Variovorax paradoxus]
MTAFLTNLDMQAGWGCSAELDLTADGVYDGRAELWHEGARCCVILITRQPSRDATLERVKFWVAHFIEDWSTRPR